MRRLLPSDLRQVESYFNGSYPLPDLNNPEYVIREVSDDARSLVCVKMTTEVSILLDPKLTALQKAKLIRDHFNSVRRQLPTTDTHLFITEGGEEFASLMRKHFNFEDATGIPLYWSKYGESSNETSR